MDELECLSRSRAQELAGSGSPWAVPYRSYDISTYQDNGHTPEGGLVYAFVTFKFASDARLYKVKIDIIFILYYKS